MMLLAPNTSKRKSTVNRCTTEDQFRNENVPNIGKSAIVHFPTDARTVVKRKGKTILKVIRFIADLT